MKRNKIRWLAGVVFVAMVVGLSAPAALPVWINQKYTNNTGQTAYDLTKGIRAEEGCPTPVLLYAHSDSFDQHEHSEAYEGCLKIRWYDGQVSNGNSSWFCAQVASGPIDMTAAYWTDAGGSFIGIAGVSMWASYSNAGGNVILRARNTWRYWDDTVFGDTVGTVSGSQVYYALSDTLFALEALNENLFTDPSITWQSLSNFNNLAPEQTASYDIGPQGFGKVVLFRFLVTGKDSTATNYTTTEIAQFEITTPYPTMTQWGLIIFAGLFILALIFVIRRRRARLPTPA